MSEASLKVVLLLSEGVWQHALAHRLANVPGVRLSGIVIQHRASTESPEWLRANLKSQRGQAASKIAQRLFFRGALQGIEERAMQVFGRAGQPLPWPRVPTLEVSDINGGECVAFVRGLAPDAIAVSGTETIKEPIFQLAPPRGLLNLHTGIAPFYKGGPNCTLWCLANGEPQFIGASLHVLDEGAGAGGLLVTAQARIEESDTAASLVCKSVSLGHEMYVRVLAAMAKGAEIKAVPQSELGPGRTYHAREWSVARLVSALRFVGQGKLRRWVQAGRPGAKDVRLVNALEGK